MLLIYDIDGLYCIRAIVSSMIIVMVDDKNLVCRWIHSQGETLPHDDQKP